MIITQPKASDLQELLLGLKFSGYKHLLYTANIIFVKKKKEKIPLYLFFPTLSNHPKQYH